MRQAVYAVYAYERAVRADALDFARDYYVGLDVLPENFRFLVELVFFLLQYYALRGYNLVLDIVYVNRAKSERFADVLFEVGHEFETDMRRGHKHAVRAERARKTAL